MPLPRLAPIHARVRSSRSYPQLLLVTCLVGMYSTTFTATVFSVAVKVVADDLDSTPQVVAWVVTAPLLAQAVAMPVLGRLGDIRGHRRVYLTGFSLAVVLCLATSAAWNAPSLIVLRTLAQVAGTATVPASFALLFRAFPPDQRVRAAAWASSTLAGASVTGLAFGGVIVDSVGWRPLFVIQAGLAALALLPATVVIEPDDEREAVTLDRAGAVALAVAAFSLAFGANRAAVWGLHPVVLALAALLPAVCWLLMRIERTAPAPILPLELLRRRDMRVAGAASFLIQGSHMGSFIITPLLLQSAFGYSATATSLITLTRTMLISVSGPVAGRLGVRLGPRRLAVAAGTALAGGSVALAAGAGSRTIALAVAAMATCGAAFGHAQPSVVTIAGNAVDDEHFGSATSLQQTAGQIGGVVVMGAAVAMVGDSGAPGQFAPTYLALAALAAAGAVVATRATRATALTRHPPSPTGLDAGTAL